MYVYHEGLAADENFELHVLFNDPVFNPLTPVPAMTCVGLCSTSDLITFDQTTSSTL